MYIYCNLDKSNSFWKSVYNCFFLLQKEGYKLQNDYGLYKDEYKIVEGG